MARKQNGATSKLHKEKTTSNQNPNRKSMHTHFTNRGRIRSLKSGVVTGSFPTNQTERMKKEIDALRQQMEFVLGVTRTGLDIIDSNFNIRFIDTERAKVYGDPAGKKCYEYFMNRNETCPNCGIPIALKTKRVTVSEETFVKEGNRPIQVTTIPFQDGNGEWLVAEVNVDISERKRAEEALRKAYEELEERVRERTAELARANEDMKAEITERQRAEAALRESERKYRELTDLLPEMVYESDENGNILFANRCGFETFGYTQEDLDQGLSIFQMINPEHREKVKENLELLFKGKRKIIGNEYTALRKDGTSFPVIASANLIIQANKPVGVRGMVINITDRKRAEEALKESEEKYRLLVENVEEAIFVAQDGMLKFGNRKATKIIGYLEEELLSKPFLEFIHPDDQRMVLDRHLKRLEGEEPPSLYPFRIITKSGDVKWVELNAVLITWGRRPATLNFLSDITERKQAEEALRASEERYRNIIESIQDGYFEDDLAGNFTFVNDIICRHLGYTKEELIGMNYQQYADEENRRKLYQHFNGLYRTGQPIEPFAVEYMRKNGSKLTAEISVSLISDLEGRPIGFRGISRDITERKQAEEEKLSLHEQLRQSQKMEAIGQLAGGVAHDFNNLLTVIKGYSQLSLLDLEEGTPLRGNIQEIEKATQRATDLTRQLLAFSRRQILDPKVLNLNFLLKDLEKMLRRIIGEDIELVTLSSENLGKVKVDPSQIEQVIFNLAVNARDAMPAGGKLTIETANVELDEEYARAHVNATPGRYVRLSISDTGVGMTREVKEKVFEPFFTTKEKGKGTGLGLSMVYGIVNQSGGHIWLYSEPGRGTTFRIYFPRTDEEANTLRGREETEFFPRGSETVLLVEDDELVRDLAKRLLKQQGYTVLEAANGQEALDVAKEHLGETIHLLLADIVMPQMGGKELADWLKISRPNIKVLFTSGYTDNAIVHHGVLDPGTHFLQKPFSLKTLSHKVREVLDG